MGGWMARCGGGRGFSGFPGVHPGAQIRASRRKGGGGAMMWCELFVLPRRTGGSGGSLVNPLEADKCTPAWKKIYGSRSGLQWPVWRLPHPPRLWNDTPLFRVKTP
eukprot:gene13918-biopygen18596